MIFFYVRWKNQKKKNNVNIIQKNVFFFVFRQINIINYFKSINSSKVKFFKFKIFTINFNSTSIKFVSINRIAKISQISKHTFVSKRHIIKIHCFFHICRFCHETFTFNNALHRHLRNTHLIFNLNRTFEKRHSILHDHKMSIMIESIKFAHYKFVSNSTFRFWIFRNQFFLFFVNILFTSNINNF